MRIFVTAGIISRLPYLKELGIGAVWLSPFYKSPMKDFGYDVSDYRQVDPLFGTLDDFEEMVSTAHGLGKSQRRMILPLERAKPEQPNEIFHCYLLSQFISFLMDVGWYFSLLFKF